jgi:hypothetical protein
MSNSYKYIDPDYTYTDPNTGLLIKEIDYFQISKKADEHN